MKNNQNTKVTVFTENIEKSIFTLFAFTATAKLIFILPFSVMDKSFFEKLKKN